jgi:hypothetical protein
MVLNGLLYNLKTPQGMLVISAGLYNETRKQATIQLLIIIIIGIVLTPFLGIYGVVIASILSNLYRTIDLLFFIPKIITKLPVKNTVYRYIKLIVGSLLTCLPILFVKFCPTTYVEWLFIAIIWGIYSICIVLFIDLLIDRNQLKFLFKRIKLLLRRA